METSIGVERPRKKPMQTVPPRKRTPQSTSWLRYLFAAVLLIAIMTVLKGAIAWLSEQVIYSLPIAGGLLKSLELVEVSNVIVFAILGVGLGAFSQWLPKKQRWYTKAISLAIAVPLVLTSGYAVRHHLWVQQVAIQSELLPAQAEQVTDSLLKKATGHGGLVGFFQYTVQVPILPTDLSALQSITEDDKWFRSELTRFSGLEPGIFTRLFRWAGWGIRLFYIGLAVITAIIYFAKGLAWAAAHRKP